MSPAAPRSGKGGRESFAERAYRELKRRILDNRLTVGTQYMEQEVAELLSMSRTPTREALIRLANEGLVEIRPRHGMRIKPISLRDMREIYEVITALEASAAALAARDGLAGRVQRQRAPDRAGPHLRRPVASGAHADPALASQAQHLQPGPPGGDRGHRPR